MTISSYINSKHTVEIIQPIELNNKPLLSEEILDRIDDSLTGFDQRLAQAVPNDVKVDVIKHFMSLIKVNRLAYKRSNNGVAQDAQISGIEKAQYNDYQQVQSSMKRSLTENAINLQRTSIVVPVNHLDIFGGSKASVSQYPNSTNSSTSTFYEPAQHREISNVEESHTPELVSSSSLASLSDDALSSLSSVLNTQLDVAHDDTPAFIQDGAPEKNQNTSAPTAIPPKKKTLRKSITTIFNTFKKSLKKKTKRMKSTFSAMSLSSASRNSSKRNSKASSAKASTITEPSEIIEQEQSEEIIEEIIEQVTTNVPTTTEPFYYEEPITELCCIEDLITEPYHHEEPSRDTYNDETTTTTAQTQKDQVFTEPKTDSIHKVDSEEDILPTNINGLSFCFEDLYDSDSNDQYDKLYELIKERQIEYQDEQAIENELGKEKLTFNVFDDGAVKTTFQASYEGFEHMSLMPPVTKKTQAMASSKTEGLLHNQDSVPYVCIGEAPLNHPRNSIKAIEVDDIQMYKRSMSVYSHVKDYDLQWQTHFHEDHKDTSKLIKTLKSVSYSLYELVKKSHEERKFECDRLFNENMNTEADIAAFVPEYDTLTEPFDIYEQIAYVFDCGDFASEHAVLAYIYIRRMLSNSKQNLWDFTWRFVVLTGLLTAIKVFDDGAVFNADFAMVFPEIELSKVNKIEAKFLQLLDWNISVSCSEFADTYFYLRSLQQKSEEYFE